MDQDISRYHRLNALPSLRRHWAYGIACYAHAVDFETPIFISPDQELESQRERINPTGLKKWVYHYLTPGSFGREFNQLDNFDHQGFEKLVLRGLQEDSAVKLDNPDADLPHDTRRIALYFSTRDPDYHFIKQTSNGHWSHKAPFSNFEIFESLPLQIEHYRLRHVYARHVNAPFQDLLRFSQRELSMQTPEGNVPIILLDDRMSQRSARTVYYNHENRKCFLSRSGAEVPWPSSGPPII